MHIDDARKVEASWDDKPCDRPDIISQRDSADIWYCTQCGMLCDYDEWAKSQGMAD